MMIEYRGYRPEDLAAMYELDVVCFQPPFRFTRAAMRKFAEDRRARVVIADADGELVGFCIVQEQRDGVGYVVTLDVAPDWRRQGLASVLMERAEAEAHEAGCGLMALHVFVANDTAIRFYGRMGYVFLRDARDFYGAGKDAAVYTKQLIKT